MKMLGGKLIMRVFRFVLHLCLPFALTGCASVPLMSLPKLMALDIETLDIETVELAVRLDDTLGIQKKLGCTLHQSRKRKDESVSCP